MKTFKKGDRVVYNPMYADTAPSKVAIGAKATIVEVDNLLVQFDKHVGGHSAHTDSGIPAGCGWYVNSTDISKVRGRKKKVDAVQAAKEGLEDLFSKLASLPEDEAQELFGRVNAKQADPLAEFFDILSTLPEDELKDLLGEAKSRQKKVDAEKYYKFENEYELNGDLLGEPLHIRVGLANDGFEHKEIGFNSELTPIICKGYGDNIEEIELTSSHYIRFKVN
jgi:hypothetical protein